jgi:hypothetical protein
MRLAKETLLGLPTDFIGLHPLALGYADATPGSPADRERCLGKNAQAELKL